MLDGRRRRRSDPRTRCRHRAARDSDGTGGTARRRYRFQRGDAGETRRRAQPDGSGVEAMCGDMVDELPDGPFDACLVAYNTIFNLLDVDAQRRCFSEVAARSAARRVVRRRSDRPRRRGAEWPERERAFDVDRPGGAVRVRPSPRRAAHERPVRGVHRVRRSASPAVVDSMGCTRANSTTWQPMQASVSSDAMPTWPALRSTTKPTTTSPVYRLGPADHRR